ncbi:hypothetical protein T02_4608 [Trichinella nativa]|uniref:Uncharacterized protein n=1 Tax=Trichinella nativa TaxID=6335 RepID=A0A0V1KTR0_9BILA|nr:hypothetical protein T02_4608 [Trichinella nativa]
MLMTADKHAYLFSLFTSTIILSFAVDLFGSEKFFCSHRVRYFSSLLMSDKKWCKDSVSTNLDVTSMLGQIPHMDKCPMDPHFRIFYLNKKSAILFANQKANLILIFGVKSKLSISPSEQNRLVRW